MLRGCAGARIGGKGRLWTDCVVSFGGQASLVTLDVGLEWGNVVAQYTVRIDQHLVRPLCMLQLKIQPP